MLKDFLKNKQLKTFVSLFLISLLLSVFVTIVYAKLPPFYIYSYNYALVPSVEQTTNNFNYNNFYQGELSKNITQSISLFAATSDFKEVIQKYSKVNVLYLMSKTNGSNLINLKLVTLQKINSQDTEKVIFSTLEKSLKYSVNTKLDVKLISMPDFNNVYSGGLSLGKFFTIVLSSILLVLSSILFLKKYYAEN